MALLSPCMLFAPLLGKARSCVAKVGKADVFLAFGSAELKHGAGFNLHRPRMLRQIKRWISNRKLWYVHFETPCTAWSISASPSQQARHAALGVKALQVTLLLIRFCDLHWFFGLWRILGVLECFSNVEFRRFFVTLELLLLVWTIVDIMLHI